MLIGGFKSGSKQGILLHSLVMTTISWFTVNKTMMMTGTEDDDSFDNDGGGGNDDDA